MVGAVYYYNESIQKQELIIMYGQSRKSIRQSRHNRKMSFSSQLRSSAIGDNLRGLDYPPSNPQELQNVFDLNTQQINPTYCDTIRKCTTKGLLHIGICLQIQQTISFLKSFFGQNNKHINAFTKINQKKYLLDSIIFAPYLLYKHQNCSILFWVLQSSLINQKFKKKKTNNLINIFSCFPQALIIDKKSYSQISGKSSNLAKKLRFNQQILIHHSQAKGSDPIIQSTDKQNQRLLYTDSLQKKRISEFLTLVMKKNAQRCLDQILPINLYILITLFQNQEFNLTSQIDLPSNFNAAANSYLTNEVQSRHANYLKNISSTLPRNQKQLENQLVNNEQEIRKQAKKNIKMLNQHKLQKPLQVTFNNIFTSNQQTLLNNKQQIKKQNNALLSSLYDELLSKFDKGRYTSTKDRVGLMAEDLNKFMVEYEQKAVKSDILFINFNNFMKENKIKYYQKLQFLQDQIDQNKKNQNFNDVFDKIEMKKKMLFTLQKQVKQLETRKLKIQSQNQKLKKIERQLELGRLDTENQQLFDVDSMKSIKVRQVSPRLMSNGNPTRSYTLANQVSKEKKRKKKCCCNCVIF